MNFLDEALDFENHQTQGVCFWFGPRLATTSLRVSLLILLTKVFIQGQFTRMHVVHPISPLWKVSVSHGCLALSSWETSLGGGLGNVFASEGTQPIFCRVLVVEAGSCSGCTKEKGAAVTRPHFVWGEPWLLQKWWREGVEMWVRFIKIICGL